MLSIGKRKKGIEAIQVEFWHGFYCREFDTWEEVIQAGDLAQKVEPGFTKLQNDLASFVKHMGAFFKKNPTTPRHRRLPSIASATRKTEVFCWGIARSLRSLGSDF